MGSKMKNTLVKAAMTVVLGLVLTGCSTTNEKYNAAVLAEMSDRNTNILATGYAVISIQPHDNPAQQRLLSIRASKLDAYRSLVEQVYGQYLDANTTIAQMVVESDDFRARVQGVIYGANLVSITPVGDDTYETTLSLKRNIVNDLRLLYLDTLSSGMGN
tara:strand:+ start:32166 stop:32645 length:480 start_codon:yes stop_codon:yes gene_type:complete